MQANFGENLWNKDDFIRAYSYRFTETPDFTQYALPAAFHFGIAVCEGIARVYDMQTWA